MAAENPGFISKIVKKFKSLISKTKDAEDISGAMGGDILVLNPSKVPRDRDKSLKKIRMVDESCIYASFTHDVGVDLRGCVTSHEMEIRNNGFSIEYDTCGGDVIYPTPENKELIMILLSMKRLKSMTGAMTLESDNTLEIEATLEGNLKEREDSIKKELESLGAETNFMYLLLTMCYDMHLPLELSPDVVQVYVNCIIASIINSDPELYRDLMVASKEGVKELSVIADGTNNWDDTIRNWGGQIMANSNSIISRFMVNNYSTTTPASEIASIGTVMNCNKAYYRYSMYAICGIPSVRMTGTYEDWVTLKEKTKTIFSEIFKTGWRKYGIESAKESAKEFMKVIDMFVLTKYFSCNPDIPDEKGRTIEDVREWWSKMKNIVEYTGGCDRDYRHHHTGWIADFFPYINTGDRFTFSNNSSMDNLQSTIVSTPIEVNFNGAVDKLEINCGLMGIHQYSDGTLTGITGYTIKRSE